MDQEILLSQSDGRPMYLQIMEQVKLRITIGDWEPGFQLPSIRELAVAARVSVITVKRAYQELENEGVIMTRQGKGSFVVEVDDLSQQLKEKEMKQHINDARKIARELAISDEELLQKIRQMLAGEES